MIEDTAKRDPKAHLLGMMEHGSDNYIVSTERLGGAQMRTSDLLPTDTSGTDADFEALGFVFGEPDPSDPLFRPATLPDGWAKEDAGHTYGYWTAIVDERGIERAAVFYKAAFYDRKAHMRLSNVGWAWASKVFYGEGANWDQWAVMTPAERAAAVESLSDEAGRSEDDVERLALLRSTLVKMQDEVPS